MNLSEGNINKRIDYLESVLGSMEELQELLKKDKEDFSEEYEDIGHQIKYWEEQLQELYQEREDEASLEQEQYEYEMACMNYEFERERIYGI